jgi:hypothetical protein
VHVLAEIVENENESSGVIHLLSMFPSFPQSLDKPSLWKTWEHA